MFTVYTKNNVANLVVIRNGEGEILGKLKFFNKQTRLFSPEEHRFEKGNLLLKGLVIGLQRVGKKC